MKGKLLFEESQTFRFTWSWYLIIVISIAMTAMFIWANYRQLAEGVPWGGKPLPDLGLIIISIIMIALTVGGFIFLHIHELNLQVDEGGIRYRFYPYFSGFRSLKQDEVKDLIVKKYSPVFEYGGWGYRIRWRKKAFSVVGDKGLEIHYKNKRILLIGTQRPQELKKAVDKLKSNWGMS